MSEPKPMIDAPIDALTHGCLGVKVRGSMSDVESKYLGIPMQAVIDRFEGDRAVLRFQDGQELSLDRHLLTEGMGEGSSVKVYILDDKIDQQRREDLAKSILNEVLADAS